MFEHAFGQVSGFTLESFHAIASRWIAGRKFDFDTGESHVYEVDATGGYTELPTPGIFASIWRSRSGAVHVAHKNGALFTRQPNGNYTRVNVRASLLGVWGLDDENVFAWGLSGNTPVMYRRDTSDDWLSMPCPRDIVFNMSGDRSDRLLAVGMNGSISLWNGGAWAPQSSPVTGALSSIHWVSEQEIYVCGTGTPFVLEGSIHGWSRRGPFELPMHCVAKHSGKLWVGCGISGLYTLPPTTDTLELVKPNVHPWHFDPREDLLISQKNAIVATKDGAAFSGVVLDGYRAIASAQQPTFPVP